MDDKGILYIATGDDFVKEAEISAQSVSKAMPNIPIAIATDARPEYKFDHVVNISKPHYGFQDKITQMSRSPFDKTLYLDTDVFVNTDVNEVFELLNEFEKHRC